MSSLLGERDDSENMEFPVCAWDYFNAQQHVRFPLFPPPIPSPHAPLRWLSAALARHLTAAPPTFAKTPFLPRRWG